MPGRICSSIPIVSGHPGEAEGFGEASLAQPDIDPPLRKGETMVLAGGSGARGDRG